MTSAAQEIVVTAGLMAGGAWAVLTGDTFLPSCVGSLFAVYIRTQQKEARATIVDYGWSVCVAIFCGIIVGPYLASQMPDGDGVAGVGALIASFMGVGTLTRLHQLDWDVAAWLKDILTTVTIKLKDGDK